MGEKWKREREKRRERKPTQTLIKVNYFIMAVINFIIRELIVITTKENMLRKLFLLHPLGFIRPAPCCLLPSFILSLRLLSKTDLSSV